MNNQASHQLFLAAQGMYEFLKKSDFSPEQYPELHDHALVLREAVSEYEFCLGPLPDWAHAHNHKREPVPFAQLITRNPHQRGNGIIASIEKGIYVCYTDMGNRMNLSLSELRSFFEVGPYISKECGVDQRRLKDPLESL